jgi:exodeoxyribonuclease-3
MKIVTWNVNSIRARLERVLGLLRRHEPDLVCLQEIKTTEDQFPREVLREAGYHAAVHGQRTYNGVALLSREPLDGVTRGFDGDPVPEQARVIAGSLAGTSVVNAYVINGKDIGHEAYDRKLHWFDALSRWIDTTYRKDQSLLITGDFNIAPDDRDVHDPSLWRDRVLCSDAERTRLKSLLGWGLHDLHRDVTQDAGVYTWWDYRAGAWPRNMGLRIDLFLGTDAVAQRLVDVCVDRDERKKSSGPDNPSDHAPVILTLAH